MFVSDLRHFLDLPADVPAPARRMADHLALVVRAATATDAGVEWVSALPCGRRPGRRPCPGHIAVCRTDIPLEIWWRCTSCGDDGVISGWEGSPFDLRGPAKDDPTDVLRVVFTAEVAATLRTILFLDADCERLLFRATPEQEGVVLSGGEDDFEELVGAVAAEGTTRLTFATASSSTPPSSSSTAPSARWTARDLNRPVRPAGSSGLWGCWPPVNITLLT